MILEDYLDNYEGIVITVSHDRYFLDRVVRRIFAFEGEGKIVQYEGGYTDYMQKRPEKTGEIKTGFNSKTGADSDSQTKEKAIDSRSTWGHKEKLKFTFNEKREYETIESDIESLENQIAELEEKMLKVASDFCKLNALTKGKEALEEALTEKMERWEYLENLAQRIEEQNH